MAERDPGNASNEQAPPINDGGGGGGSRFGRLAIIIVALILLLLAVPFACQAIRGSGGESGNAGDSSGGSAGESSSGSAESSSPENSSSEGGSSATSQMESTMQAATGSTMMEETAGEGTTVMSSSGGSEDAPQAELAGLASGQLTGQNGDGSSITIPSATLSGASGWVAVSESDEDSNGDSENGEPGEIIGYAPLEEGENEDVSVSLDSPVSGSGELVVSIHEDAPADDDFTYPDGDPTTETADGEPATETVPYDLDTTSGEGSRNGELPDTSGALNPGPYLTLSAGIALLALGAGLHATTRRNRAESAE